MACRMGKQDRIGRVTAGVILVGFALITGNPIGWLGLVPLITGAIGWCPLYEPFDISTCETEGKEAHGHH
ncbi:YgaP family membrane protein [Hydrogenimonas sp.]